MNNAIILKKFPYLLEKIQNMYLPPFIFSFDALEPSGSIYFLLLTHRVFLDKPRHHTEPWVPHLETKLVGLDMCICKH